MHSCFCRLKAVCVPYYVLNQSIVTISGCATDMECGLFFNDFHPPKGEFGVQIMSQLAPLKLTLIRLWFVLFQPQA